MYNIETWMDFEQALQGDAAMQGSFQTAVEELIRGGVSSESELLFRGAEKLGFALRRERGKGEPMEALEDEELDHVAGGRSLQGDGSIKPFDLNSWLGAFLRDLLKRNSTANAQRAAAGAVTTLPLRPTTPEISELNCL